MSASVTLTWDEEEYAGRFLELYSELCKWGYASFSMNGGDGSLLTLLSFATATRTEER